MHRSSTHPQLRVLEDTLPHKEIRDLSHLGTVIEVEAGRELTHRGEAGHECFLILAGTVEVDRGPDQPPVIVGPRQVIGELALLSHADHRATARAKTDVTILALSQDEFDQALNQCPEFAVKTLTRAVGRLASTLQSRP